MAKMPMAKSQDKVLIKKVLINLGNVAIGANGYSTRQPINSIQGYTLLVVSLANFTSNPGKSAISVSSPNNNGEILVLGVANTTINSVIVECVYVSNDYFDVIS